VSNLLTRTDPNNEIATLNYDNLNRVSSFVDVRNDTTSWTHDTSDSIASTTDSNSVTTSYVRNGWGEVIQESSGDIGTVVYERNELGDIIKRTDGRGEVVDITYDVAGRMLSASYPSESTINVTYSYDAGSNGIGELTSVTDAAGSTAYTYDSKGRVTQETRTIGAQTYTTAYQWDLDNNVTQITYPSGRVVTYNRNAIGDVSQILTRETASSGDVGVAWWVATTPSGPRQGMLHGNGLTDWRTYDEDGRLVTQYLQDDSVTPLSPLIDRFYGYLDNRNLTQIVNNLDTTRTEYYTYNDNGSLENGIGPWGNWGYTTDGVGNMTQKYLISGGSTTTTDYGIYSGTNLLVGEYVAGTQTRSFGYDGSGNIIVDTDNTTNITKYHTFNAAGQLKIVVVGGQYTAEYQYDYLSRLSLRYVANGNQTLHYVHDLAGNIIAEYDGSGSLNREYIWLDERPMAVVDHSGTGGPVLYHVHTDHLERPVMMTDLLQNVVWEATYQPYGEIHQITGSATLDQRFPGQWFQLENGLHYNWHRHYDPTLGRYIQADPLGMPDGPSRFAYAVNSPLMYTDPTGEFAQLIRPALTAAAGFAFGAGVEKALNPCASAGQLLVSGGLGILGGALVQKAAKGLKLFGKGGAKGGDKPFSSVKFEKPRTKRAGRPEIKTDVPLDEAIQNLKDNGFSAKNFKAQNGGVGTVLTKGNKRITTFPVSTSTGGPSAKVVVGGKRKSSIRFGQ
ncbi:MAG: RHS repeat-associated core domain-containing protein, partial [Chloroflexota bacterium]